MKFLLHILIVTNMVIPLSLAYTFLFGKGKVLNFGPFCVALVAAYGIFITVMHTGNYAWGLAVGFVLTSAISALLAWLSLRLEPDALGVMTIALHLVTLALVLNWTSVTRGALGITRIPRLPFLQSMTSFALVTTLVMFLWVLVFLWIDRSPISRQMEALAEHEWHAKALGVNRALVHFVGFLLIGLTTLSDNLFFGQYLRIIYPNDYNFPGFIFLLMIVVAGRPGSMVGAIISTVLLVLLKEGLRFLPLSYSLVGPTQLILYGIILYVAVWWRRDVLFPHSRTV